MTIEGIIAILAALTTLAVALKAMFVAMNTHALVNSRLTEFIERYDRMETALKDVREVLARERADRVAERVAARKAGEGPQL